MSSSMIPFTDNYRDKSTEYGYQFEFICERCGNGYSSSFQKSAAGIGGGLLRAASNLFGGRFGGSAYSADQLADMARGTGRDNALRKAVDEMRPFFHQCHRCGDWVCRDVCWNEAAGLCTNCAPKMSQELGALQSEERLRQVRDKLTETDLTQGIDVGREVVARCPKCMAETHGAKFCPECGTALATTTTCSGCGASVPAGVKFCPECGRPMTAGSG